MESSMKSIVTAGTLAGLSMLLLGGMSRDEGTAASTSEPHEAGIPIERLITIVARKTGKRYVVDPRVRADVQLIGQDPSTVTYPELLTILQVHGFTAAEGGGYIRVIPDANSRQTPTPQLSNGQTFPDAQV